MDKTGGKEMQMNDENIQTEEVKRAAEPEYKIPEDATDNSRPNETAEVVTRESAEETNTGVHFGRTLQIPTTTLHRLQSHVRQTVHPVSLQS